MAGFFGLFGRKDQPDYYLEQDDAQSFGNAEFMRRPQEVKKTFPKISGGQAFTPPKTSPKASFETPTTSASTNGSFSTPSSNIGTPSERRQADSSMDMFLNMAKNLKK
jgi:hypothetical protein